LDSKDESTVSTHSKYDPSLMGARAEIALKKIEEHKKNNF